MFLIGTQGETGAIDFPGSVGHWVWNDVTLVWEADPANPVLVPEPGAWDGFSIVNLAVIYHGGMFRMWYGASAVYHGPGNVGYATSLDGSLWTTYAGNPLASLAPGPPGSWDERGLTPFTVLFDGGSYRMWYTAEAVQAWGYWRIGHAISPDALSWTREPNPVLEASEPWEGIRVFNPEVVRLGDSFAMWHSGIIGSPLLSQVGYAVSPDGLDWRKWVDNPMLSPTPPCDWLGSLSVIVEGDTIHGWFNHCSEISYATSLFEVLFFDGFESGNTDAWSLEGGAVVGSAAHQRAVCSARGS
jgi:hypothetical protein